MKKGNKSIVLTVRFENETYKKLEELSLLQGMGKAELIRKLVLSEYENNTTLEEFNSMFKGGK